MVVDVEDIRLPVMGSRNGDAVIGRRGPWARFSRVWWEGEVLKLTDLVRGPTWGKHLVMR